MKSNFTIEECNELISYHSIYDKINISEIGGDNNRGIKKDIIDYNVTLIYRDEKTQWVFDKIHNWLLDEYPKNIVNEMDMFYNFEYLPSMKFEKHVDRQRNCSWHLVVGATLNTDFKGGDLILYEPDGIAAENVGEIYSISAERPHAVTPISEGIRYSFVFFISKKELGIPKTIL